MDFVWNRTSADSVRDECEHAMCTQITTMQETADFYLSEADRLSDLAESVGFRVSEIQERLNRGGDQRSGSSSKRENDLRSIERGRILSSDYSRQAIALRTAARELKRAARTLDRARVQAGRLFNRMHRDAEYYDNSTSGLLQYSMDDINSYIGRMERMRDSFSNPHPFLSMLESIVSLDGIPHDLLLNAILFAAQAGCPIFSAFAGDPVNMSTGNFIYFKKDMTIPGRFPLTFERFYNAFGGSSDGVLGADWTHSYNIRLKAEEKLVSISFGDGHVESYIKLDNGQYIPAVMSNNAIVKENDGWLLRNPTMETYSFDKDGLLQSIIDINGNSTEFTYSDELLATVSTLSGQLSFVYNKENLVTTVCDHTGKGLAFEYKDGRLTKVIYPNNASDTYIYADNGRLSELVDSQGTVEVKTEFDVNNRAVKQYLPDDGVIEYIYDDNGRNTTLVQQNGCKITYKYDEKNRTTGILYSDGEKKFEYDVNNRQTASVDKLGNKTQYAYNVAGSLLNCIDENGVKSELNYTKDNQLSVISVDGQEKVKNTYDESKNLVTIEDALKNQVKLSYSEKHLPETITQPDGSKASIIYDERGNITKITDNSGIVTQYSYDDSNCVVGTIDGNGNETTFKYDLNGNITEVKNALGDVRTYTYNEANKVTCVTDFNGSDIRWEYNILNFISKRIDQLGRETLLSYDVMRNLSSVIEPNGAETKYMYDTLNRLESVQKADGGTISYKYDANGNRTGITDEAGNQTTFKYDKGGQLLEVIDSSGILLSCTYSKERDLTSATNALGIKVTLDYDKNNRLVKETDTVGNCRQYTYTSLGKVSTVTDEAGLTTEYDYELGGRLRAINYPDKTKETYSYDKVGNVIILITRFGQRVNYEYDRLDRVVKISDSSGTSKQYTYDKVSNVTSMTDANGNTTMYEYTLTGQLAKVIDALGNEAVYTYDECDRLIEIRQGADNTHVVKYERNILGQIEGITDALGNKESYSYDFCGQLIEKLDKDAYLTKYDYTVRGDVSRIEYADGREVELTYNPLRRLTEVRDWLGVTKIELDSLGNVRKVTNHDGTEVSYMRDAFGQRTGLTYPDGMNVSYVYDKLMRIKEVCNGVGKTQYTYDALSRLAEKVFSDGTKTKYSYDDLGRLQELSHANGDDVLDRYMYSYDSFGNKKEVRKERSGLLEEGGVFTYTYDPLNRLQKILKDGQLLRSYEYDEFGNRTKMTDCNGRSSYTYNSLNQLISMADAVGDEQSYTYDKRGNVIEIIKNGNLVNEYNFGALNRLEHAINHETGFRAEYRYNGLSKRVGQSVGGAGLNPTKHIDDVLDLTRGYNNLLHRSEGDVATSYIWDGGLLSSVSKVGITNYMLDSQGSPIRFGQELYNYDEFGNNLYDTPSEMQPFGFTGYQHDPIAGTWFAQAREYSPYLGRFLSEDVVKGVAQAPLTMNPYTYCWNRPLDLVDLDGRHPIINIDTEELRRVLRAGADAVGDFVQNNIVEPIRTHVVEPVAGIVDDVRNIDLGNTDPQVVIDDFNPAEGERERLLSGFNGQIAINMPNVPIIGDLITGSGSIGPFMPLTRSGGQCANTILHESGHFCERRFLGLVRYYVGIGLPSMNNVGTGLSDAQYMSQPWEIIADILGGVNRTNLNDISDYTMPNILRGLRYFNYVNNIPLNNPLDLIAFIFVSSQLTYENIQTIMGDGITRK